MPKPSPRKKITTLLLYTSILIHQILIQGCSGLVQRMVNNIVSSDQPAPAPTDDGALRNHVPYGKDTLKRENQGLDSSKISQAPNHCLLRPTSSLTLLHNDVYFMDTFKQFLATQNAQGLSFQDKAILYVLAQMWLRPDQIAPESSVSFLSGQLDPQTNDPGKSKLQFFETGLNGDAVGVGKKNPSVPLLEGLLHLAGGNRAKVLAMARLLDQKFRAQLYITPQLATFLSGQQKAILASNELSKSFSIEQNIKRKDEPIDKFSLEKFWAGFFQTQSAPSQTMASLKQRGLGLSESFTYRIGQSKTGQDQSANVNMYCSHDLGYYEKNIRRLDPQTGDGRKELRMPDNQEFDRQNQPEYQNALAFGMVEKSVDGKFKVFFMDAKLFPASGEGLTTWPRSPVLRGTPFSRANMGATFCLYPGKFLLVSNQSRDTVQQMFHFSRYNLNQVLEFPDVQARINYARYMVLDSPVRILFESGRAQKGQITMINQFNFPIYHANKLGEIWGMALLPSRATDPSPTPSVTAFADPRGPMKVSCQQ